MQCNSMNMNMNNNPTWHRDKLIKDTEQVNTVRQQANESKEKEKSVTISLLAVSTNIFMIKKIWLVQ